MSALSIGEPAPDFTLQNLDGQPIQLSDFRGRPALLYFWSAECPWVERADRELIEILDRAALIAIASNANEPLDLLRSAAAQRGLPVVLVDPDQQVSRRYGVQINPHFFLLDSAGILRYQGALDDVNFRQRSPTRRYVRDALEALLASQPIPVTETPPFGCTIVPLEALE